MKRTVVLTSTENFVWSSMQEIIPAIEEAWVRSSSDDHLVRIVDVDREPIGRYLADALASDHVVMTCFTYKLARVATFLRKEAGVRARYIIYLHNQATIACWPLYAFGPGETLTSDDVFVSSSRFDARTLKLTYAKPNVVIHPFWLPHATTGAREKSTAAPKFVYAGRLSSQKNLHTLLLAFAHYSKDGGEGRLVFHGGEDGLGSPNMGFKDEGYLGTLQRLGRDLGLDDRVEFTGNLSRETLHSKLEEAHVLIAPGLHSDENFGMSVLRSLCLGNPVVMTRWGGHADFRNTFGTQVFEVPVRGSSKGPWVDPKDLALQMAKAARVIRKPGKREVPAKYRVETMAVAIRKMVGRAPAKKSVSLRRTALAAGIEKGRSDMKIFDTYADRRSHRFFDGYGMAAPRKVALKARKYALVPWAEIEENAIRILDPHRGSWSLSWKDRTGLLELRSFDGQRHTRVPRRVLVDLVSCGWAFTEI